MIRRMRTAFKPTEDASFNVRIENQKIIAHYLKKHPMGAGIGGISQPQDGRMINTLITEFLLILSM